MDQVQLVQPWRPRRRAPRINRFVLGMQEVSCNFEDMESHSAYVEIPIRVVEPAIARRIEALVDRSVVISEASGSSRIDLDHSQFVDLIAQELVPNVVTPSESGWRFLLSLLQDLANWGSVFKYNEDGLFVRIPIYDKHGASKETNERIRIAMSRLKSQVAEFHSSVSERAALRALEEEPLSLRHVTADTPELTKIFTTGVGTWSMPYRSREGRTSRFVLLAETKDDQLPVGILEIGDDAPHNPARDAHMGFATEMMNLSEIDRQKLVERFQALRSALLDTGELVSPHAQLSEIFERRIELRAAGKGRADASRIAMNKRLTYLCRLAEAEAALVNMSGSEPVMFNQGLRVLRDLTIPRVSVEMTICGALPPFGGILGGKVIASMAGHPLIRRFTDRPFGQITSSIFDVDKLAPLLPRHGVLIVTTKGLYPGHSAQYNRVRIPNGTANPVFLRKLGDTNGQTSSHISLETSRLATQFNDLNGQHVVSNLYGSGGAKRQRIISGAVLQLGLPSEIAHAYISRPVYGVNFVSNLSRVVLYNESPEWTVEPFSDLPSDIDYCKSAIELWRLRWGANAADRVQLNSHE